MPRDESLKRSVRFQRLKELFQRRSLKSMRLQNFPPDLVIGDFLKMEDSEYSEKGSEYKGEVSFLGSARNVVALRKMPGVFIRSAFLFTPGTIMISKSADRPDFPHQSMAQRYVQWGVDGKAKKEKLDANYNEEVARDNFFKGLMINYFFDQRKANFPQIYMTLSLYNSAKLQYASKSGRLKYAPAVEIVEGLVQDDVSVKKYGQERTDFVNQILANALFENLDTHCGNYFLKDGRNIWIDINDLTYRQRKFDSFLMMFLPDSYILEQGEATISKAFAIGFANRPYIDLITVDDFLEFAKQMREKFLEEKDGILSYNQEFYKMISRAIQFQNKQEASMLKMRLDEVFELDCFLRLMKESGRIQGKSPMTQIALSLIKQKQAYRDGTYADFFSLQDFAKVPSSVVLSESSRKIIQRCQVIPGILQEYNEFRFGRMEAEMNFPYPVSYFFDKPLSPKENMIYHYKEASTKQEIMSFDFILRKADEINAKKEVLCKMAFNIIIEQKLSPFIQIGLSRGKIISIKGQKYFAVFSEKNEIANVFRYDQGKCEIIEDFDQVIEDFKQFFVKSQSKTATYSGFLSRKVELEKVVEENGFIHFSQISDFSLRNDQVSYAVAMIEKQKEAERQRQKDKFEFVFQGNYQEFLYILEANKTPSKAALLQEESMAQKFYNLLAKNMFNAATRSEISNPEFLLATCLIAIKNQGISSKFEQFQQDLRLIFQDINDQDIRKLKHFSARFQENCALDKIFSKKPETERAMVGMRLKAIHPESLVYIFSRVASQIPKERTGEMSAILGMDFEMLKQKELVAATKFSESASQEPATTASASQFYPLSASDSLSYEC